MVDEW